jgi:uracil-DNA glycosylase
VSKSEKLKLLYEKTHTCMACPLSKTRTNYVFGEGSAEAKIMFIGEGPGKNEDFQGRPFVGRSGELLTAIIEKGMKTSRKNVFIANIVKCRPTINMEMKTDRAPTVEETNACKWILCEQIEIIKPKVIVTLGNPATKFILNTKIGITKLRGKEASYKDVPVVPTYHPSYVLRNGGEKSPLKKDVWKDIQKVMKIAGTL